MISFSYTKQCDFPVFNVAESHKLVQKNLTRLINRLNPGVPGCKTSWLLMVSWLSASMWPKSQVELIVGQRQKTKWNRSMQFHHILYSNIYIYIVYIDRNMLDLLYNNTLSPEDLEWLGMLSISINSPSSVRQLRNHLYSISATLKNEKNLN